MRSEKVLTRVGTKSLRLKKTENQQKWTPVQTAVQPLGAPGHIFQLQRQYGNRFVQRLVGLHQRTEAVQNAASSDRFGYSETEGLHINKFMSIPLKSLVAAGLVQRKPGGGVGSRRAIVQVRWTEDSVEFYHRLVNAIARTIRLRAASLWQPVHPQSQKLYALLSGDLNRREGQRLRIAASLIVGSGTGPEVTSIELTLEQALGRRGTSSSSTPAPASSASAESENPQPNETLEQRLRRQAATIVRLLSNIVAEADSQGFLGAELTIEHSGKELIPGFTKLGERQTRRSGTTPILTSSVQATLRPLVDMILLSGQGRWIIDYARNERGIMTFMRSGATVPRLSPTTTGEEGIPPERSRTPAEGSGYPQSDEAEAIVEDIRRTRQRILNTAAELIEEQNPARPENILWSVGPFAIGRLARLRQLRQLGGLSRLVGRAGSTVFGEVRFRGLIRQRPLRELTHNEIYEAFRQTAFRPSSHAIMRLKHERTDALGMRTLADVEQLLNRGVIQESRGLASIQRGSMEAIVNVETGVIVTISPL